MIKHIASILSQGRLEIDCNNCVINIIPEELNSVSRSLPYSEIDSDDWGYIYEKYVGQKYEEEGYQVEYLGLKNGFLDGGMDIIIRKDDFIAYIQCKYSSKSKPCFGKQKIFIPFKTIQRPKTEFLARSTYTTTNKKRLTRLFPIKKQFSRHGQIGIKGNTYAIIIKPLLNN